MTQVLHSMARTTHHDRAEIQHSNLSKRELARRLGVHRATVDKWKSRDSVHDRSHCPKTLHTTLTPAQEVIVVALRTTLLLPLDDLLSITKEFINPNVSRSGLGRCLNRHKVGNLRELQLARAEEQSPTAKPQTKSFKDYEPGYLHIDIKYLPQMPDEQQRRYLFVAIDRATRWVFIKIYDHQDQASSTDFLHHLHQNCPVYIRTILTDNGTQFTDRFSTKNKQPSLNHPFDKACQRIGAHHRLIPPKHPQTNGMVERFNGRISEVITSTRFANASELETSLLHYLHLYNHHIPQRALNHLTPAHALDQWLKKKPELFKKPAHYHAGLDI